MPHQQPRRQQCHHRAVRRQTVLAAALGFAGLALLPVTGERPAQAATAASPCYAAFTASAAADLVTLRQVDLGLLGVRGTQPDGPLLGSSRAGLYAGAAPLVAARAGQVEAANPGGYVYQIAPPSRPSASARTAGPSVSGQVSTGARALTAVATLRNPAACDAAGGPVSRASFDLLSDSSLVGRAAPALVVPAGAKTGTETDLALGPAGYAAVATATTAATDLRLLNAVTIRIGGAPTLRISATGGTP
jgi:hypothetical protein